MQGGNSRAWAKKVDVQVTLALSALLIMLSFLRTWNLWITDIFVSDEYGYIYSAFQGQVTNVWVGFRTAFGYANIGFFGLFNINSTDRLAALFPMYIALWYIIAVIAVWQTLRALGYMPRVVGLTLVAFVSLPAFIIPSLGFFTEGMAVAFASVGVCLIVRYLKESSVTRGVTLLFLSGVAFWLAMHAREPFALFFLGLGLIPIASAVTKDSWKVPLALGLVCLVAAQGVAVAAQDPVSIETQQSFNAFGQAFVINPLMLLLGLQHPNVVPPAVTTQTTTTVSTSQLPTAITTTRVVTSTFVSNGNTTTSTSTVTTVVTETYVTGTFTFTVPVNTTLTTPPSTPIQATGILAFLGISTVPDNMLIRSLLLVMVSLLAGYGVLLVLPIAGSLYIAYEVIVKKRFRRSLAVGLLSLMFLATLAGVTLVFAGDPSYFGTQHYSTLLRFASTTLPGFPLVVAPLVDRLVKNTRVTYAAIVFMLLLYGLTAPAVLGAAVSNLQSYDNPLYFQAPAYAGPMVLFRDYVVSHPTSSPFVAMGLDSSLLSWTPGLSGRGDVTVLPYLNGTQVASLNATNFYLYVQPEGLLILQRDYPVLGALASNALSGNSSLVDGFRPLGVVFDNTYGVLIHVERATA